MSVYFYGCITLDGYLADKNHGLNWLYESGTTEETSYDDFYRKMNITIMGKRTFDEIAKTGNADSFYPTTNYVFTNDKKFNYNGFVPVHGDVIKFVKEFDEDKKIWIVGGNQILAPLLNKDIVDVMIIQIAPVLLGAGISLFTQQDCLKRFALEEVNKYGQFAELVYKKM